MWSDYRQFGVCPTSLTSTAGAYTAVDGSAVGFMHLLCQADAVLADIVLRYPKTGDTQLAALNLVAGQELLGIKSFTLTSGTLQIFYFKS